jgi:ferric-dicitrate binding protein FerR (iron transport regulator)
MDVKEARQFVADFSKGEYSTAEHAAFLQWLYPSDVDGWEGVAGEHEALHGHWVISTEAPPREWVEALEDRLNRLVEIHTAAPVATIRPRRKVRDIFLRPWLAVASIIALIVATGILYNQRGRTLVGETRKEALSTLIQVVAVARGGAARLVLLPDGSKVWLNVASTLKYPMNFSGSGRVVELSGEAYFEVSQLPDMPFKVLLKDAEVKVLGTRFNIMDYNDEPSCKVSLIDGAVSVDSGPQRVMLHPGEQGEILYLSAGVVGPIKVTPGIDPPAVLSWKDGVLRFENTHLQKVMRTLERCYDVDIQIDQGVPDIPVTGSFTRGEGLGLILKQLERVHLHSIIHGKNVSITLAK